MIRCSHVTGSVKKLWVEVINLPSRAKRWTLAGRPPAAPLSSWSDGGACVSGRREQRRKHPELLRCPLEASCFVELLDWWLICGSKKSIFYVLTHWELELFVMQPRPTPILTLKGNAGGRCCCRMYLCSSNYGQQEWNEGSDPLAGWTLFLFFSFSFRMERHQKNLHLLHYFTWGWSLNLTEPSFLPGQFALQNSIWN